MDDEEDVKRMNEILDQVKQENVDDEFLYEEFIESDDADDSDFNESDFVRESPTDEAFDIPEPVPLDFHNLSKYDLTASLKESERQTIEKCLDPDLKRLLILNRTKSLQLMHLYKQIKDILIECRENIEKRRKFTENEAKNNVRSLVTGIWRLGYPYFKDKDRYQSPPNEDTLKKNRNKELPIYEITLSPRWTPIECERLLKFVKFDYNVNQRKKVMEKIKLVLAGTEEESKKNLQIKELESQLDVLQTNEMTEVPPRYSEDFIIWENVANMFAKARHSDFECRSMWNIYLHPDINKSTWSDHELKKLKFLVKKYKNQNWDQIATDLGTNRSSFQLCTKYFHDVLSRYKKGDFDHDEDLKLLNAIEKVQVGDYIPWGKIARMFSDRSRSQLYHRYKYFLSQKWKLIGKFTLAEDAMLMLCVDRFGRSYRKCELYIPNRTLSQCKSRYMSHCFGKVRKGSFTVEEDELILNHYNEHGYANWHLVAKKLKRNNAQVRTRYTTIKHFFEAHPNKTLRDMVRRQCHKEPVDARSYEVARKVADHFLETSPEMPTLKEIQQYIKEKYSKYIPLPSSDDDSESCNSDIDQNVNDIFGDGRRNKGERITDANVNRLLMEFFSSSYKVKESSQISPSRIRLAIDDVENCLEILQADLDIPTELPENDERLDKVDREILGYIASSNAGKHRQYLSAVERVSSISTVFPPNMYTALGMRGLLIKHSDQKSNGLLNLYSNAKRGGTKTQQQQDDQQADKNIILRTLTEQLSMLDPLTKDLITCDRNLFYQRFHSLFKLASVLTVVNPTILLMDRSMGFETVSSLPEAKRTFSKADNNDQSVEKSRKRQKVSNSADKSQTTDAAMIPPKELKLVPVAGKSVLEDLMKNKEKKLYRVHKVKEGDKFKTVIKEVDLGLTRTTQNPNPTTSTSSSASGGPSTSKEVVISSSSQSCSNLQNVRSSNSNTDVDDDLEDLNKLNMFLQHKTVNLSDDDDEDTKTIDSIYLKEEWRDECESDS